MSDNLLIEEEEQNDVSAADIKAYMEQQNIGADIEQESKQQESTPDQSISQQEQSDSEESKEYNVHFGSDTTFDTGVDSKYGEYANLHINLRDDQLPITNAEKEQYLVAMLNEQQYEQEVKMFNKFTVRCRDLNMYEKQVVLKIVQDEVKKNPNTPPVVIYMLLRQCRVPMQVTEVCGKKTNVVRFEYDPDNQTADQIEKDAEFLLKKSMEMVYNTPSARYDLYMKALNVFENKLLRLHEAAFNENFLNPAEQD